MKTIEDKHLINKDELAKSFIKTLIFIKNVIVGLISMILITVFIVYVSWKSSIFLDMERNSRKNFDISIKYGINDDFITNEQYVKARKFFDIIGSTPDSFLQQSMKAQHKQVYDRMKAKVPVNDPFQVVLLHEYNMAPLTFDTETLNTETVQKMLHTQEELDKLKITAKTTGSNYISPIYDIIYLCIVIMGRILGYS